jgi:hypothetical protein
MTGNAYVKPPEPSRDFAGCTPAQINPHFFLSFGGAVWFIISCSDGAMDVRRGVAQLVACSVRDREVAGSNPVAPTIFRFKPFGRPVEGLSQFYRLELMDSG